MALMSNERAITTVTPADWVPGPRQGFWTYRSLGVFQGEQTLPSRIVPEIAVPIAQFFDWTGGLL